MVYVLIDTNGIPFLFKYKKDAKKFMCDRYDGMIKYIDTINGVENWIWSGNNEYMILKKCEVYK
jgi:hypothetical protein